MSRELPVSFAPGDMMMGAKVWRAPGGSLASRRFWLRPTDTLELEEGLEGCCRFD